MNLGNFGAGELIVLAVIFLLVFGAHRLPEAGRAVGKGIREFKRALSDAEDAVSSESGPPTPRVGEPGRRGDAPKRLTD